jgi:preprotein translocase SecF subunit
MKPLRLVPADTKVPFLSFRKVAFAFSGALIAISLVLAATVGLNFGIDFRGGTLIEIQVKTGPADIGELRRVLGGLGLGDVEIQEFGTPEDVLIRVEQQPGGDDAQQDVITRVKDALGTDYEYRRTEVVGPKVSAELIASGTIAVIVAIMAVLVYIWFRFEWQFGVAAVVALLHDVITTVGLFSLLQLEFNLATVAAILTIAGYSINDTVVVFDRVRENLRKYKRMPIADLLNLSINSTLSRTVMTSLTTLLALGALYFLGGEVIRGFSVALIWGVVIGTYSSIALAVPLLLYLKVYRGTGEEDAGPSGAKAEGAG